MIASLFLKCYTLNQWFVFVRSVTANTDLPFLAPGGLLFSFRRNSACLSVTTRKLDISLFRSQYSCCTLSKQKIITS